jgi:hypothetical protein
MTVRLTLAAMVTIALTIGSILDTTVHQTPRRAGEFTLLTADLHVHGWLGDGTLPPWELRREATRRGLDVIAITNHNQVASARLGRWLSQDEGLPLVLVAQEVTAPRFHLVALGIGQTIDSRLPAADAARAAHAQGGVAIAAHPVARSWMEQDADAIGSLDGAERAHPMAHFRAHGSVDLAAFFERGRLSRPTLAAVGSTDFHAVRPLGYCRTTLLVREVSAEGVLDALREGRAVAHDGYGRTFGDAAWVGLVNRHRPVPPPDDATSRRALSSLVLLGLIGVIVCGGGGSKAARPTSE